MFTRWYRGVNQREVSDHRSGSVSTGKKMPEKRKSGVDEERVEVAEESMPGTRAVCDHRYLGEDQAAEKD